MANDIGITTRDKGVFIPQEQRTPKQPQYLHMSKKDVVEAERKRKEKIAKLAQISADMDKETPAPIDKPEPIKEEPKKSKKEKK